MDKSAAEQSRRGILRAGLAIGTAAVAALTARQATAQEAEKVPQEAVQYQSTPKDGAKCSACVNYVDPNACSIVAGKIDPNGWCVAYAPKT